MSTWRALVLSMAAAALAWASWSCAPTGFADQSLVNSVRILASSADKPYAEPGDTVTAQVLAYDGRATKTEPMVVSWLPVPCINPADDAYYACFPQFASVGARGDAGAGDGGDAGAGVAQGLQPGVDLTPLFTSGPSMTVTLPADIISSHPAVAGTAPYGLVILFNFACAGHLEYVPADDNPQQIPIGCFDSQDDQVGPDDYVFGYTRIYASETITDTNPVITRVDAPGGPLTVDAGTTAALSASTCADSKTSDCPHIPIGPIIEPPMAGREVWADFYSTAGEFTSDARLLYLTTGSAGAPSATDDDFLAPSAQGMQTIWIVVRDDHDGASWVTVPVSMH